MSWLTDLLALPVVPVVARASAMLAIGLALAWLAGQVARRLTRDRAAPERVTLARRIASYTVVGLTLASVLRELGFDLTVLLGAAGVLSVAVGFASQTSASNVISGLFLIAERPFSVGDWIKIGATTGEVVAVDLLSVKMRTAENLFVRVPNETVMKSEVTNLTRYPIRRLDLPLSIAYREDMARVTRLLLDMADAHPRVLDEPRPVVRFRGYGDSGVELTLAMWLVRDGFVELRDALATEVKHTLDANGVEIPFPHRSLYTGADSAPLPVRLVGSGAAD